MAYTVVFKWKDHHTKSIILSKRHLIIISQFIFKKIDHDFVRKFEDTMILVEL